MPTTPLDRLLFVQGGRCFFCDLPLQRAEASVEHLLASAHGGSNADGNCVACCKAVNALLGSMSLKDKFRVVLNQRGDFKCPNPSRGADSPPAATQNPRPGPEAKFQLVVENLVARKAAKPRTLKTLTNSIATLFPGIASAEVEAIVAALQASGKVQLHDSKVSYQL
ncbi:HNH endonuclease [Massilia sp. TS11]|uniref:HNH endonuclease n=1 Tax=Massilia sp. TS11 TaxID=2908003 RepID=UPI001EDC2530|nr:HNH endonuclease signature motif containing protein [Massilia sp. TS11]MCG2584138.1 HNH endonuclease [Massilia sp. TS11]